MADLQAWSPTTNCSVRLTPSGVSGGQSELFSFPNDPTRCAAAPVTGTWDKSYWDKIRGLIELADHSLDVAFPEELLLDPRDRAIPLGFAMRRFPGIPHTQLVIPAERVAQNLDWGLSELREVGLQFARLFDRFERLGITQNDAHGGNYLIDWPRQTRKPRVSRVDALSFGFHWNGKYFGCDAVVLEYLAPELHPFASNLSAVEFTRDGDRYGLACLLFPLLTEGGYPWSFGGAKGTPAERVARKEFAMFSNPRGTKVPPGVEAAFQRLPHEVVVLFERAFLGDPAARPAPREWVPALKLIGTNASKPRRPGTERRSALTRWVRGKTRVVFDRARPNVWMLLVLACVALAWLGLPKGPDPQPHGPAPGSPAAPPAKTPVAPTVPIRADTSPVPAPGQPPGAEGPVTKRKPTDPNAWERVK